MNKKKWYCLLILLLINIVTACTSHDEEHFRKSFKSWNDYKWQNVIPQGFDYSCGSAALATIGTAYFGDQINESLVLMTIIAPLQEKEVLDRQKNGFSLLDLQRAAKMLGYQAIGVKLPYNAVFKLKGPIIVLLHDEELDHFVVLKGIYKDRVYLADSSRGNLRMPLFLFFKQWKGVALIVGKDGTGILNDHDLSIEVGDDYRPEVGGVRQSISTSVIAK